MPLVPGPLPTALRRLAASDGRPLQHQHQQGGCFFSTNSSSAVPSESPSSEGAEEEGEAFSGSSQALEGSSATSSSPGSMASAYTVVKHPPIPGWEYPPVPAGCEPSFAVIRLGNTQHKVRLLSCLCHEGGAVARRCFY